MPDPDQAAFAGWHRRNRHCPWCLIVDGATEAECWDRLLSQAPLGGEKCVLPADIDPNHKPAPNTARRLLP